MHESLFGYRQPERDAQNGARLCVRLKEEKVYKTMRGTGAVNIVVGILGIIIGVVSGILLIISGGKLLRNKSKIFF